MNHLLFWSIVWLFYIFFFSYNSANISYVLIFSSILLPITTVATYTMVYVLIPKYLNSKRYLLFTVYSSSAFLLTALAILLMLILGISYLSDFKYADLPPMSRNYAYLTILVYLIVALVSFVSVWRKNAQTKIENSILQQQLLTVQIKAKEQELVFLKNQIHPHFLFNSLNTIYGLSLLKSSETPEVILKLSGLLDYILYQASKSKVKLEDELDHLDKYIDLEKIRFSDSLKVSFSKSIDDSEPMIAPMLLLPFIENAFKHGSIIDGFMDVDIQVSVSNNVLNFSIKNTYKYSDSEDGIGLKNIKDRLNILYNDNYELKINSDANWFIINLKVNL